MKVSKIEFIELEDEEGVEVFDVTVDEYHNFLLGNLNIAHNSKDIADTVAKASWILVRQWPFSDIMVSNGQREEKSVYEQQKQQNPGKANPAFIKKLLDMQAQKQLAEKKAAMDKFNSEAFGTGRIKKGRY